MGVFTSLVTEVVIPFSMLSKIVSLACVALSAGQHVSIVGSPEWQAFKNAELAHIAPSVGPLAAAGGNYAQDQLNWLAQQQAIVAAPGPTPDNYAQAALNFVGPAPGPTPVNYAQSALDFVGPAPGPTPVNHAQSALDFVAPAPVSHAQATLNYQQEALNFIASGLGK